MQFKVHIPSGSSTRGKVEVSRELPIEIIILYRLCLYLSLSTWGVSLKLF